jgi:hypothetical protein
MDDTLPSGEPVAEGEQFWKWVWESQTKCEALTDQMLPKEEIFGKRARETFTKLGTVASMLDRVASCWWCRLAHAFVLGQSDPGFPAFVQELGKEQPKVLCGDTVPVDTSTPLLFPGENELHEK